MGKIIALGGGFDREDSSELMKYIVSLSGKKTPNYLQIPITGYDSPDTGSIAWFAKWGSETDVLYLTHAYMTEEIAAEKIRKADVIYVPGGNLKFLADWWNKFNIGFYIREAFEKGKVLFGFSSGSMCWFKQGFDDCGPEGDFMFVDVPGILPYCNVPHYEGSFWQTFNEYAAKAKYSSICCENDTAICFIDGKWSIKIASRKPDARVWFFDANDGYKRYNLVEHPEILEKLSAPEK